MGRRTMINLIFFVGVFVVMCIWAVQNIVTIDQIDKPYTITGEFNAASGILPNAEVAYLGVHYGRVTSVTRETGQQSCGTQGGQPVDGCVKMTMKIDHNRRDIPRDSIARIFRKSAIGEPYIDFKPPDGFDPATAQPDDYIRAGDNVSIDHTQNPLEFSELLRSAANLLEHIDPDKAGSLVHELAQALQGREDSLRDLTIAADDLSSTFAAKTEALDRLATNNTKITHVLGDHATDLGQSLTNLSLLAESLRNANGNTAILLDQGSELMGLLANLVDAEKGNLDCVLHDLGDVIDVSSTPERLAGTDFLLANGKQAFDLVAAAVDQEPDGPWARVNLLVNPDSPAEQYVPSHELPAVPTVPPCQSTIAGARGPEFLAAQSTATATTPAAVPDAGVAQAMSVLGGPDFVPADLEAATTKHITYPVSGFVVMAGLGLALLLMLAASRRIHEPDPD